MARLPVYLRALNAMSEAGTTTCSSLELATAAGVNSAKLRKDLSHLGSYGTRGVGYDVQYLRYQISREIGLTQDWPVVVVGIGNLGHALANYSGFSSRGFRTVALLDADTSRHGEIVAGLEIRSFEDLADVVAEHGVGIGVIATPAVAAQAVCDRMVEVGIRSILNFAPTIISVPEGVDVRRVDLSSELQILAYHEQRKSTDAAMNRVLSEETGGGMSVLVVGISHKTAPLSVLERVALDSEGVHKLIAEVTDSDHVTEATVLSTCNRTEVYADVERFHGSVEAISRMLGDRAGKTPEEVLSHLYVHYDDGAVSHLFHVASGLDSMVPGESQILGQTREALRVGQEAGSVGPALNALFQQALRVGKRSHAETDIDRVAPSLVATALSRAADHVGDLAGKHVVVVGAGSMAALTVATASRAGAASIVVANRTPERAARLASQYDARAIPLSDLGKATGPVDVLVSCTGAAGVLVDADAVTSRRTSDRPLAIVDLALPHDVDPEVADLPGVRLIALETLAAELEEAPGGADVEGVRTIVGQELAAFLAARSSKSVTPTVVALRSMATGVVESELSRLTARLPELDEVSRAEVERAIHRVAEKLLHQPTVRVKELANHSGAVSYAAALAELFALSPEAVEAVTRAEGL